MPIGEGITVNPLHLGLIGGENVKKSIEIEELLSGYVVRIGCKSVAFETKEKLLAELARFLNDRKAVTEEYLAKEK